MPNANGKCVCKHVSKRAVNPTDGLPDEAPKEFQESLRKSPGEWVSEIFPEFYSYRNSVRPLF